MLENFSQKTISSAWQRAGGKCGKCYKLLLLGSHGRESSFGWEAHHINPNGSNSPSNCQILCQNCHKNTPSYGG
ncbi:MAG: HNH endonuclease [Mariniphaga sp.]|nr:HNH endonuclease [Mariniphaga sp.]